MFLQVINTIQKSHDLFRLVNILKPKLVPFVQIFEWFENWILIISDWELIKYPQNCSHFQKQFILIRTCLKIQPIRKLTLMFSTGWGTGVLGCIAKKSRLNTKCCFGIVFFWGILSFEETMRIQISTVSLLLLEMNPYF